MNILAKREKWYFSEEELADSPSRKCGINAEMELSYRQRAANLIQEMGQRLQVSQLCINTAIVYMHRFYAFHSFTMFHRNCIAAAAFFLAAKVEEQPRKLEHVIKILNVCLEKGDISRETYMEQAQELVANENILLQTLGFDVAIDHPHTHVVKACQLFNIVTVSRELRQTCYFMASNSLHLTTMCLKYKPTVVAAFCIYIACKWSRWEIPDSSEGKAWYSYVDENVTLDTLKKLTDEYLQILERSPSKFKSKMKAITSNGQATISQTLSYSGSGETSSSASRHSNHHHHHHHRSSSSAAAGSSSGVASSSGMAAPNSNGSSRNPSSSSSSSSKVQFHQMSSNSAYKQQVPSQQQQPGASIPVVSGSSSSSSSSHMHRPRPSSSSASSTNNQQMYGSNMPSSSSQQKLDERQRMMHQDGYYSSSSAQRMSDHKQHRMSSSSSSQQQQQQQQQQSAAHMQAPYMKSNPNINDQKQHNVMLNNASKQGNPAYPMDMHSKTMKQNVPDYHGRGSSSNSSAGSSSMSQSHVSQSMSSSSQKKPPWIQQQQQQQQQQKSQHYQQQQQQQQQQQAQELQYSHLQKNLQMSSMLDQSASNLMNTSKSSSAAASYNDMKSQQMQQHQLSQQQQHQQQQQSSNASQNDFWFNDKMNETPATTATTTTTTKTVTPPRQAKSLFSPSPEHDSGEKAKYMLMTGNIKRENVDSPKEERKLTPSKRDKLLSSHHANQKLNSSSHTMSHSSVTASSLSSLQSSSAMQKDSKNYPKLESAAASLDAHLLQNSSSNSLDGSFKKRPYAAVKDSQDSNNGRDSKVRRVDQIVKSEPTATATLPLPSPQGNMTRISQQQQQQQQQQSQFAALDQTVNVMKQQPIETNPDIVKSLLKECFTSSKFDAYDTDSPLDVINPELPDELMDTTVSHLQQFPTPAQQKMSDDIPLDNSKRSDDRMDSSAGESRKDHKKKSKKKKEKHKHKKKHKSSDREDSRDAPSKFSRDSKSSPEVSHQAFNSSGSEKIKMKIKINNPMKDVKTEGPSANNQQTQQQQPAPIKLKISKEKFSFTNLNNNNNNPSTTTSSSSSSSHKKKDKDREKSKSKGSKHSSSSDFKDGMNVDR